MTASCLVCSEPEVEVFLDLGSTALANKFPSAEDLSSPEPRFPLRVGFCHACGHVQLVERVPPAAMFTDYLYVSSASDTLRAHFDDLAATLTARHGLVDGGLVIDIGCNDASLLCCFRDRGARTLGVDPAENLAEFSSDTGIERYRGFFGADTAGEIADRRGRAALITATNTFPHIPDLSGFVSGLDEVLAPGGAFVVEAHYLVDLLDQLAFDTVYHEHVSYWALGPMTRLFENHGMEVVRAERLPIHHGQLRATVMRRGEGEVERSVDEVLAAEELRRGDPRPAGRVPPPRRQVHSAGAGSPDRLTTGCATDPVLLVRRRSPGESLLPGGRMPAVRQSSRMLYSFDRVRMTSRSPARAGDASVISSSGFAWSCSNSSPVPNTNVVPASSVAKMRSR